MVLIGQILLYQFGGASMDGCVSSKEIRVEMRMRNNRLWNLIFPKWDTVAAFCRELELHQVVVGELLNLKTCPINQKTGEYRVVCEKIAKYFRVLAEDLFPLDIYAIEQTKGSAEIGVELLPYYECLSLPAPDIFEELTDEMDRKNFVETLLSHVTPRERKFLQMRFGLGPYDEHTFEEIGMLEEITRDRAHQIVEGAIKRLQRNPKMHVQRHVVETGSVHVNSSIIEHCDAIDASRVYVDNLYRALVDIRPQIPHQYANQFDMWLGWEANGCFHWVEGLHSKISAVLEAFYPLPILHDLLHQEDARSLMQYARTLPILHTYRPQVQHMFWRYHRKLR